MIHLLKVQTAYVKSLFLIERATDVAASVAYYPITETAIPESVNVCLTNWHRLNKPFKDMKKSILKHVTHMTKLFSIAFLFQCLTMSFLMAWNGNAQVKNIEEVTVSLLLEDVKIEYIFRELEKNTGYNFVFTNKELRDIPKVGVRSNNSSLYDVLLSLANQTDLTFKQIDYNIHVKKTKKIAAEAKEVHAVDIAVTGTVTDNNGEPLPGASITVRGTPQEL